MCLELVVLLGPEPHHHNERLGEFPATTRNRQLSHYRRKGRLQDLHAKRGGAQREKTRIDAQMTLGNVSESVVVESGAIPTLDVATAQVSNSNRFRRSAGAAEPGARSSGLRDTFAGHRSGFGQQSVSRRWELQLQRFARALEQHHARRRDRHRHFDHRRIRCCVCSGRSRRSKSHHQQFRRGVRPQFRIAGTDPHQRRHQRIPRLALRLFPEQRIGQCSRLLHSRRGTGSEARPESRRRDDRRTDH